MDLPEHLVLYDGHCHLCNRSVQAILKFDSENKFYFASLQSATGLFIKEKYRVDISVGESILYIRQKKCLQKSDAALWIASEFIFPYNLLAGFIIVPAFIRNFVYDHVAKNRYRWFGKSETCILPEEKFKIRFLDL